MCSHIRGTLFILSIIAVNNIYRRNRERCDVHLALENTMLQIGAWSETTRRYRVPDSDTSIIIIIFFFFNKCLYKPRKLERWDTPIKFRIALECYWIRRGHYDGGLRKADIRE